MSEFVCAVVLGIPLAFASSAAVASRDPASSEARALGEKLFFDKRLSVDGATSCATCHDPEKSFADGKPVAIGAMGKTGSRNTPSLTTVSSHNSFSWDGRSETLERQVMQPLVNAREHGLGSHDEVVAMVRALPDYAPLLAGQTPTVEGIAEALATFVRSLAAPKGRFDRYLGGAKLDALTAEERVGFELFRGPAQCAGCHLADGAAPTFTDNGFHALGVSRSGHAEDLASLAMRSARAGKQEIDALITGDPGIAALGRYNVTKRPGDIGKYRTPSLRNVSRTAPYMHDGSVATLEEAVDAEIYYRSSQQGRPLILTPQQRRHIVAFLRSLDSESEQPGSP